MLVFDAIMAAMALIIEVSVPKDMKLQERPLLLMFGQDPESRRNPGPKRFFVLSRYFSDKFQMI